MTVGVPGHLRGNGGGDTRSCGRHKIHYGDSGFARTTAVWVLASFVEKEGGGVGAEFLEGGGPGGSDVAGVGSGFYGGEGFGVRDKDGGFVELELGGVEVVEGGEELDAEFGGVEGQRGQ